MENQNMENMQMSEQHEQDQAQSTQRPPQKKNYLLLVIIGGGVILLALIAVLLIGNAQKGEDQLLPPPIEGNQMMETGDAGPTIDLEANQEEQIEEDLNATDLGDVDEELERVDEDLNQL